MYHFVQTSLEVERKPQRRREKSKAHPLFPPRRKAQTQEKKGNKASISASSTLNECGARSDIYTSSSFCSCSSSNTNSRSETSDDTPGSFVNTFPRAANTSDPIRVKCREMLANALQTGGKPAAVAFVLNVACVFFVFFTHLSPYPSRPQTITSQSVRIVTNLERRSKTISFPQKRKVVISEHHLNTRV